MRGLRMYEARRARELRQDATSAEARLWAKLRGRALNGYKFVRQVPIGPYFADFVCRERKLIVEVDGATHGSDAEIAHDARRSVLLAREGYKVLRVQNVDVFENLSGVLETIVVWLDESNVDPHLHVPSPRLRGEG